MQSTSRKRGGKRVGAGRPVNPNSKIQYSTKLSRMVVEYLRGRDNAAETIDLLVRRSKKFKLWEQFKDEKV